MNKEQGNLSINSENIFPIIKKWLYSDHDIFVRELVSNASDAITKCKKLELMGELELSEDNKYKIEVIADAEKKTLTFIDNGIGMTDEEIRKYINDIAFSGAQDFLNKYKDKTNDDQIIGHFGLGFYSAFMVSDKVTIDTLSWQEDAKSVHWESDGGTTYTMSEGDKKSRGTEITLYLNEDSYEFCNEYRAKEVLNKYCSFMPVEIYFTNPNAETEYEEVEIEDEETIDESVENDDNIIDAQVDENGEVVETEEAEETKEKKTKKVPKKPEPINNIAPLWTKHPNECSDDEYKDFYREVFHDYKEPLFWIHLNMDYPFNLKGILYFPKLNTEYDTIEGTIKLYSNQVFVADNVKEVIPEFLLLLKGVIDCPDFPLNVSRSALQNDGFVKKISDYITKKVADKLSGMYKVDRENYEKFWDDINPFIKFGCLRDQKFNDRMKDFIIFKNLDGKYISLAEYSDSGESKEEDGKEATTKEEDSSKEIDETVETKEASAEPESLVFYVTDEQQQSQYINLFKEEEKDAIILTHNIDQPFITHLEQMESKYKFQRIDADITKDFKDGEEKDLKEEKDQLSNLFRKVLNNEKLNVEVMNLKNDKIASMITLSEESRRMQDMMKMYSMGGMDPSMMGSDETLVLNAKNNLVQYILENKDGKHVPIICQQLYDLAMIGHKPLDSNSLTKFIARSNEILELLAE